MKLSTLKKWSVVFLFGLSFLIHFGYDLFPNSLFAIFFPVNESVWEHMKLLYTTIVFYGAIEYFIIKKKNISVNNYLFSVFITSILAIPIYLILFYPFYLKGFNQMWFDLLVMFITYIICSYVSYFIMTKEYFKYQHVIAIIGIILSYILFGYLTYHPIHNDLFLDVENEKYGINDYII